MVQYVYVMNHYVAEWDSIPACCTADLVHTLCSLCQSAASSEAAKWGFSYKNQQVLKCAAFSSVSR